MAHGIDSKFVQGQMPTKEAVSAAISGALADCGVDKKDVGLVSAHGSGVAKYDEVEVEALKHAFGDHVKSLKISASKNQLGNTLAAAGALEAAVCAKVLVCLCIYPALEVLVCLCMYVCCLEAAVCAQVLVRERARRERQQWLQSDVKVGLRCGLMLV